jgi:dienelactone hydrolase
MKSISLALLLMTSAWSGAEVTTGEIAGARFMIATPDKWQGKLVLIAHGYRPEGSPLDAEFDAKDEFAAPLLEKGWSIASTSYRRNGWIVEDALLDLKALRDHVVKEHGEVKRCLVIGSSMGGLIGTLAAEGALDRVDGVVAIGAYLGTQEREGFHPALSWQPKAPLIYLTNQDELEHPKHYRTKAGPEKTALWVVKRDGHCNTSDSERLQALLAVDAWVDGTVPAKEKDGTVYPPVRESTAKKVDGGLEGKVTLASESWGNLSTGFVAADLTALGLKTGDQAVVSGSKGKLAVKVVGYRSDVASGEGALYLTPNGWVAVVINGGNAAKAIGVTTGDTVVLAKVGDLK